MLGDFNAPVGARTNDIIVGPLGDISVNENEERLIEICQQRSLKKRRCV